MSKANDAFAKAGEMFFEEECKPVKRVYVDLEYIQDLRFGALLNTVTIPEEISYIYHKIKDYNNKYDRSVAKYFKALHKTDKDLDDLLHSNMRDKICLTAPFTSVYYNMLSILKMSINHAKEFPNYVKPTLVVNCSDIDYPDILMDKFVSTMVQNLNINIEWQNTERYSLQVSEYQTFDILFLYDYGQFVKQHATSFIGEGKFTNNRIIADPYIEPEIILKSKNLEYVLESTEKNMDIYCDFNFLRSCIINKQ